MDGGTEQIIHIKHLLKLISRKSHEQQKVIGTTVKTSGQPKYKRTALKPSQGQPAHTRWPGYPK